MRYYRAHFQRTIDMRVYKAFFYSLDGLKAAFRDEAAFREVVLMAVIGMPLALWLDLSPLATVLILLSHVLTLVVELLNTGIEAAIEPEDRRLEFAGDIGRMTRRELIDHPDQTTVPGNTGLDLRVVGAVEPSDAATPAKAGDRQPCRISAICRSPAGAGPHSSPLCACEVGGRMWVVWVDRKSVV